MDTVKQAVGMSTGPRLVWLGLGNMGKGMVKNIVEKGKYSPPMLIFNRTTSKTEEFAKTLPESKIKVATTIQDCVTGADIIFICLGDDAAIKSTIDTIIQVPEVKGKLIVDCSTVSPDTTNEISKTITDAGAEFVACPVFGAPAMAESGSLITVLAGPKASVDKVLPYCKGVTARAEVNFSDEAPGNASRLKIVGNSFILMMVEALSQGHVLAEKTGLGVEELHKWIEVMFPGPYTAYSNRLMSGDYYLRQPPGFMARLASKDFNHAKDLADNAGVKLKCLEVAGQHLKDVQEYAGDKGDIAGIYGVIRQESGLPYENQKQ